MSWTCYCYPKAALSLYSELAASSWLWWRVTLFACTNGEINRAVAAVAAAVYSSLLLIYDDGMFKNISKYAALVYKLS